MKRGKNILITVMAACVLTSCSQGKASDVSSVSIAKDGSISHRIVGDFEQNYYETDGLEELAQRRIEEYCAKNGTDGVELKSVEESGGKVVVNISYLSGEDYMEFNNREFFAGTLTEAQKKYDLDRVAFVSEAKQPMEIGSLDKPEEMSVVIIATKPDEELVVNVSGKVRYINQSAMSDVSVVFEGKKSVHITNPADAESEESELSYIIFER